MLWVLTTYSEYQGVSNPDAGHLEEPGWVNILYIEEPGE